MGAPDLVAHSEVVAGLVVEGAVAWSVVQRGREGPLGLLAPARPGLTMSVGFRGSEKTTAPIGA